MTSSLFIQGVERTDDLVRESLSIVNEVNNKNSQMTFSLRDLSTIPSENDVVEFYDGDTLQFSGKAININQQSPLPEKTAAVQVSDWYDELLAGLVRQTYSARTLWYIIRDIVRDKVLTDDLKVMLQFEEGTGTTAEDSTGFGNDATLDSGVTWDTVNYAVDFDGTDDAELSIEDDGSLDFVRSLSLCIDFSTDDLNRTLVLKENNSGNAPYAIQITGNGNIVFAVSDGSTYYTIQTTGSPITAGQRHTIVCTLGSGMGRIYVDGVLTKEGTLTSSSLAASTGALKIGKKFTPLYAIGLFDVLALQGVMHPSGNSTPTTNLEGTVYRFSAYSKELSAVEARRWDVDILEVKAPSRLIDSADIEIASAGFFYEYPADCFSALARELELAWWIDEKMFLHFVSRDGAASVATFEEDDGQSVIQGSLRVISDRSQVRNVIYVRGGTYPGQWRKDILEANGVNTFYPLPYQFTGFEMFTDTVGLCGDVRSWFTMEEASGNLTDAMGTNNLTAANLTYQQTGQLSDAVSFNGSTSSARKTSASHVTGDDNHSMAAWIRPDVHDTTERVICGFGDFAGEHSKLSLIQSGGTYYLRQRFSGSIAVDVDVGDLSGAWHLVGMSFDSSVVDGPTLRLYLDGTLVSTTIITAPNVSSGVLEIGGNNGSNVFDGLIDEVTFFDYALSDQEQQSIYLMNTEGSQSALLLRSGIDFLNSEGFDGYYNFQEKSYRFDTAPADGVILYLTGSPNTPVLAVRTNQASIRTYGRRELEINDETVDSLVTARSLAAAELSRRKSATTTVAFQTLRSGRKAGDVITLDFPSFGVTMQDFIIQKVSTQFYLPTLQGSIRHLYSIECTNVIGKDWIDFLRDAFTQGKRKISPNETETIEDLVDHGEDVGVADAYVIATPVDHAEAVEIADGHTVDVNATGDYKWSNDEGTTEDKLRWDLGAWS
jgi:hypothetical protein